MYCTLRPYAITKSYFISFQVALIFGITGACRRQELNNITTKDVENHGTMLLVRITNTKNKIPRSFTIHGPFYEIVKKYEALRSTKAKTDRFFLNFQKGKCTCQPIGINKFGSMPKEIAKFLALPDADSYTGHSFRRTSATLLADSGADILTLKRHGGWRSDTVAESYVEDSIQNKANISAKITQAINLEPESKKFCPEPRPSTSDASNFLVSPSLNNYETQNHSTCYENVSLSPTFTAMHNPNNDTINNTITQTVQIPTKTIAYHFNNCTFTNCFNN